MIPAIIAGAAALTGIGIQVAHNKKQAKRDHDRNKEMLRLQQEYNSIEAQKERMEKAGLNSAAILSNGNPSTASSLAQGGKEQPLSISGTLMDGVNLYSKLKTEQAQRDLMQKEAHLLDVQANGVGLDNQRKELDNAVTEALDNAVISVPGLGTMKGARFVKGVSSAKDSIIETFSNQIGFQSLQNEFAAKQEYDWWRKQTSFDTNILYDEVYADLKRRTDLRLTEKEIELASKHIADLGSQMVYRSQMTSQGWANYALSKKRYKIESYSALSNALVASLTQEEQVRHNKQFEKIQLYGHKVQGLNSAYSTRTQGILGAGQMLSRALTAFTIYGLQSGAFNPPRQPIGFVK